MIIYKAEKYRDNALTKELQDTPYPMCDETCGEVCIEDYMSGYNQAIEDSLCSEMLEMLKYIVIHASAGWYLDNEDISHIKELIKEAQ